MKVFKNSENTSHRNVSQKFIDISKLVVKVLIAHLSQGLHLRGRCLLPVAAHRPCRPTGLWMTPWASLRRALGRSDRDRTTDPWKRFETYLPPLIKLLERSFIRFL